MATKVNFYENYGDKSARERAELIYSNYSSFQGIIEDCKMRLIYEIKAEQEIIIPLLKQEKDYYTLAEEAGVTVPVVRRKASRIHCELISYMENYFVEKL